MMSGGYVDFVLRDQNGKEFKLSEYRSKKILLSFHPLAWTPVCTNQMISLERNNEEFEKMNMIAVGISVDSVPCKKEWAKQIGIEKTRLLSDFWPHGEVAKKYGVFREKDGFSERANIIIDEEGKIIFRRIYQISELPDINEIMNFIEGK